MILNMQDLLSPVLLLIIFFFFLFWTPPPLLSLRTPIDLIRTSDSGHVLAGIPQEEFVARRISKTMWSLLFWRLLFCVCLCTCFISLCNLKETSKGRSKTMNCYIIGSLMLSFFSRFPTLCKPLLILWAPCLPLKFCSFLSLKFCSFRAQFKCHFLRKTSLLPTS